MSTKAIRFYAAIDTHPGAKPGTLVLESTDGKPLSGKATRVTLSPAQTAHLTGILSDPKALAAALKAGTVSVPTGKRGPGRKPRTGIAALAASLKPAKPATKPATK